MKVIGNLTKDAIIRAAVSEGISVTQVLGSASVFESASMNYVGVTFDSSNNKIVVAYRDQGNSSYGTAVVGTVSGTSISFGTPVVFYSNNSIVYDKGVVFDTNSNKVVISYAVNGDGYAIVGTVSGTSISFGTAVNYDNSVGYPCAAFDSSNNKVVLAYEDGENSDRGTSMVGTVSGTSISFGSAAVFETGGISYPTIAFDSNAGKIVAAYNDKDDSNKGKAAVGTVSGTSISFGTPVVFNSGNGSYYGSIAYDSTAQKVVIAYSDGGNSDYGTAVVGTVSGTSISFGSEVVFNAANTLNISVAYDSSANRSVIFYKDNGNSNYGTLIVGTISGTSISFGDEAVYESADTRYNSATFDSNSNRLVVAYADYGNSNHGTAVVVQTGYSSATGGTIADGKAVIVNANGTVSSIAGSAAGGGSAVTFNNASTFDTSSVFDSNSNKVIVAYRDVGQSQHGYAIVGTVSGTSISFGTPVEFENAVVSAIGMTFDSNSNKVVIFYKDEGNSFYGTSIVGTVSGTSISFGTPVVYSSATTSSQTATFDTNSNKVVVGYTYGAKVGTISGTSISYGSVTTFTGSNASKIAMCFDTNSNKVVVSFRPQSDDQGYTAIGTVSGTSISFGTAVKFNAATTSAINNTFDSNSNKVVVAYDNDGNSSYGTAIVGTVSGTSISFGSPVVFSTAESNVSQNGAFNTETNTVVLAFVVSSVLTFIEGTVSGTSISFGSAVTATGVGAANPVTIFDSNAKKTVASTENNPGQSVVFSSDSTNLTSENFVGFMDGAALDGTNGEILSSCSIARNQTSLTPGQTYFVSPTDGALSLTAGSPSVTAGTAISSTELIVKG